MKLARSVPTEFILPAPFDNAYRQEFFCTIYFILHWLTDTRERGCKGILLEIKKILYSLSFVSAILFINPNLILDSFFSSAISTYKRYFIRICHIYVVLRFMNLSDLRWENIYLIINQITQISRARCYFEWHIDDNEVCELI